MTNPNTFYNNKLLQYTVFRDININVNYRKGVAL